MGCWRASCGQGFVPCRSFSDRWRVGGKQDGAGGGRSRSGVRLSCVVHRWSAGPAAPAPSRWRQTLRLYNHDCDVPRLKHCMQMVRTSIQKFFASFFQKRSAFFLLDAAPQQAHSSPARLSLQARLLSASAHACSLAWPVIPRKRPMRRNSVPLTDIAWSGVRLCGPGTPCGRLRVP